MWGVAQPVLNFIQKLSWNHMLDIGIMWFLLYQVYIRFKGTQAMRLLVRVFGVWLIYPRLPGRGPAPDLVSPLGHLDRRAHPVSHQFPRRDPEDILSTQPGAQNLNPAAPGDANPPAGRKRRHHCPIRFFALGEADGRHHRCGAPGFDRLPAEKSGRGESRRTSSRRCWKPFSSRERPTTTAPPSFARTRSRAWDAYCPFQITAPCRRSSARATGRRSASRSGPTPWRS